MKKFPSIDLEKYLIDFNGYKYTLSFVGNPSKDECLKVLCYLSIIFKNKLHIFSSENDFLKSIEKIKHNNLLSENDLIIYSKCHKDFEDKEENLIKIYNATKINLNINNKKRTSSNFQLFQTLAAGGFTITNEKEDLEKYFEISKQLETFENNFDLVDKIDFYLENINIAQKIALSGKFKVIKNQNFPIRIRKAISI